MRLELLLPVSCSKIRVPALLSELWVIGCLNPVTEEFKPNSFDLDKLKTVTRLQQSFSHFNFQKPDPELSPKQGIVVIFPLGIMDNEQPGAA